MDRLSAKETHDVTVISSADKELETDSIDVKFNGLEVTTASEGLNLFRAAHFMLHYYCCQKREEQILT